MKKNLKRILNTCSIVALIVSIMISVGMISTREVVAAWDGTTATTFAAGKGTETSPYVISTQNQMGYFMKQMNAGVTYNGLYIKLNCDLDMSGGNWKVSDSAVFAGTFMGNNKTLTMDSNFLRTISATGKVDWLNINGSGTLSDPLLCYDNNGTIQNCRVQGDVSMTNTSKAGLLCLYNNQTGLVVNSCGVGSVYGESSDDDCYVGWISRSDGTIKNSYADMTLSGSAPGKYNTFYSGQITGKGSYENCYGGAKVIKNDSSFVANLNGTIGVPGYIWTVDSNNINQGYPVIKACLSATTRLSSSTESLVVFHDSVAYITLTSSESGCTIYYTLDGTDPTSSSTRKIYSGAFAVSTDTLITSVAYKNGSFGVPNRQQMVQLLGSGTSVLPYIISTNKQLYVVRLYPDKVYELNRDLDFTSEPDMYQGNNWESIPKFSGELRGNGHSITGLSSVTGGLVGDNSGIIQELRLIDHQLCVSSTDYHPSNFGAIANDNYGTITRCYAGTDPNDIRYTTVTDNYAGGIVGYNSGTVSYCSSSGTIKLTSYDDYSWYRLGGIVGYNVGTVQSCYSDMRLHGAQTRHDDGAYVSGIAFGGTVNDSRFDGHCEAESYTVSFGVGAGAAHGDTGWSYRIYNGGATFKQITNSGRSYYTKETDLYTYMGCKESDYPAYDFDSVWMMTTDGPMPQGIMDAEGRCMAKYSYTEPTCNAGCAIYYDMLNTEYQKTEIFHALGHRVIETIESITTENDSTYPFTMSDGVYTSTNKTNSSKSVFTITALYDFTLKLEYSVSSESGYDMLTISKNGTALYTKSGIVSWTAVDISLKAGDTLTIRYSKDSSLSKNNDEVYFKLLNVNRSYDRPADEYEPTCAESVVCSYCQELIKAALGHSYSTWEASDIPDEYGNYFKMRVCSECGCEELEIIEYGSGDADGDGVLSNSDITLIIRAMCGWDSDMTMVIADANYDGKINNRDIIALIRRISCAE